MGCAPVRQTRYVQENRRMKPQEAVDNQARGD